MTYNDLMDLNLYERHNCLTFLSYKTKYNIEKYKYPFPLNRLTAMTFRIKDDLRAAIKEILKLEQEKLTKPNHTKEQLENMLYEDLRNVRRNLRKIKVVQMEKALPETIEQAKIYVKENTNEFLEPQDLMVITDYEGRQMFGEDYDSYTNEELLKMGYQRELTSQLYSASLDERRLKEEIRDQIITFITQIDKTRNIEDLYLLSLEDLKEIYEQITVHLESLPTYEDIAMSAKMGL